MFTKNQCGRRLIDDAYSDNNNSLGVPVSFNVDNGVNPPPVIAQPLVQCACPPCLVLVVLTEQLSIGQTSGTDDDSTSAAASIVHYDRDSNDYITATELAPITVYHVLTDHDTLNDPVGAAPLGPGDRAWAYFNSQSGRWEILHQPSTTARFELTADLTYGSSAAAERIIWNSTTSQYETSGQSITVYDAFCNFNSVTGCRGLARFWPDSGRWEISRLDPLSTACSSS